MVEQTLAWKRFHSSAHQLLQTLRQGYALATQDRASRRAIVRFRKSYQRYAKHPPLEPHSVRGLLPTEYQNCLYLHGLYRRTPQEEVAYKTLLAPLALCEYEEDVLQLARDLFDQYAAQQLMTPSSAQLSQAQQKQLWLNSRNRLSSLSSKQQELIHASGAFDYVSALLMSLVESKLLLQHSLRALPANMLRLGIVVPVHQELARLKPKHESLAGEDFFRLKIKQLEFLLAGITQDGQPAHDSRLRIELLFICDEDATHAALERLRQAQTLAPGLRVSIYRVAAQTTSSKATNVWRGFAEAQALGCDLIAYTDADLSANLGQLGKLVYPVLAQGYVGAIGSRGLPDSWVFGVDSLHRHRSRVYNLLTRLLLGLPFADTQMGLKLFTTAAVSELMGEWRDSSMAFDTELLVFLHERQQRVKEVGLAWRESALESQSGSPQTVLEMLLGLCSQSRRKAGVSTVAVLSRAEVRDSLITLGSDHDLNAVLAFCARYYELLEPAQLTEFVSVLHRLIHAVLKNELTTEELAEFRRAVERLLEKGLESRLASFILDRYPQLAGLCAVIWQNPALLAPILCFLLGGSAVARVLPGVNPAIPSFYQLLRERDVLAQPSPPSQSLQDHYQSWLEQYNTTWVGSRGAPAARAGRPARATPGLARRAAARKLLDEGLGQGATIYLVVPAMGAVCMDESKWDERSWRSTAWEIDNFVEKLTALAKLLHGVRSQPHFQFHFMTGLAAEILAHLPGQTPSLQTLAAAAQIPGVGFTLYGINRARSTDGTTYLAPYSFDEQRMLVPRAPVVLAHPHRTPLDELSRGMPKGTLLFLGFAAVLAQMVVAPVDEANAFLGYCVATSKIPIEEYIFLLRALRRPPATLNRQRLARVDA